MILLPCVSCHPLNCIITVTLLVDWLCITYDDHLHTVNLNSPNMYPGFK